MAAGEITQLLFQVRDGRPGATDELFQAVYQQLKAVAGRQVAGNGPDRTLNSTAVVHEAYLKLADPSQPVWRDRTHFYSVAALVMRHIVIDYARQQRAQKRGGGAPKQTLHESRVQFEEGPVDMLALDEALSRLAELSSRLVRVVELRFFAGLSVEETAEVLKVTPRTIKRDWRKAKAFLYAELGRSAGGERPTVDGL